MRERTNFRHAHVATAVYQLTSLRCWKPRDVGSGFHVMEPDIALLLDWAAGDIIGHLTAVHVRADDSYGAQPETRVERDLSPILEHHGHTRC